LTWKRPAHGISPRNIDAVLGMAARVALEEDTVLQWQHLE
jgi:N-acetylneuraminate synthase